VKVVEEKRCVSDVEGIVGVGKRQGIPDFELHLRAEGRGEGRVEPGASVPDRHGIQVDPDSPDVRSPSGSKGHEVHQIVARPGPHVQDVELRVRGEKRPEYRAGRAKAPEQSVDPPEVVEGGPECFPANVGIVHPLGPFMARFEAGEGGLKGHEMKGGRE
jgi:hypothetical protein